MSRKNSSNRSTVCRGEAFTDNLNEDDSDSEARAHLFNDCEYHLFGARRDLGPHGIAGTYVYR